MCIGRKRIYHGKFNSPESLSRYVELIAGRSAEAEAVESEQPAPVAVTVNQLLLKFAAERLPGYVASDGKRSKERECLASVMKITRTLFGEIVVRIFGPLVFRKCRDAMISKGWSRRYVNKQCVRLRHIIGYGVSFEMVPQTVADSLRSVMPLKPGESAARELPKRCPDDQQRIDAAKFRMRQRNRDLIDLLLYTGARPSELIDLRTCDIIAEGDVWEAPLTHHQNAHRGQERTLNFGPKARAILAK